MLYPTIFRRRVDVVCVLLDHGANVDGVEGQRATPVCEAVLSGDEKSLKLLIQRDANLNIMCEILDEHNHEMEISPLIIAVDS